MTELKKELKDRGIIVPASGLKKSDLIAKLAEALGVTASIADTSTELDDSITEAKEITAVPVLAKPVNTTAASSVVSAAPAAMTAALVPSDPPANGAAPAIPATESGDGASSVSVAKPIVKVGGGDAKDRLAARAARFGTAAAVPTPTISIGTTETLAALRKRTDRFGEVVSSTVKSLEDKEKLNQRANRFNLSADEQNPTTTLGLIRKNTSPSSDSSTKRPITMLSPEEEERVRKRRERFGLT